VRWAISKLLADRDQDARGAVVIVWLRALGLDAGIDVVGNDVVRATRLVLVDHGGALAVVAHARHQVTQARAAVGCELVARVPQVAEMQAGMPMDATA